MQVEVLARRKHVATLELGHGHHLHHRRAADLDVGHEIAGHVLHGHEWTVPRELQRGTGRHDQLGPFAEPTEVHGAARLRRIDGDRHVVGPA